MGTGDQLTPRKKKGFPSTSSRLSGARRRTNWWARKRSQAAIVQHVCGVHTMTGGQASLSQSRACCSAVQLNRRSTTFSKQAVCPSTKHSFHLHRHYECLPVCD
eukprot:544828-Pleurochrysis_carterae.AAC.1